MTPRHRPALMLAALLCAGALTAAAPPDTPEQQAQAAIECTAQPLRTTDPTGDLDDLAHFGRAVGDADVVGLGEATHGSHEFFALKHRVMRYLVEKKGFRSFALEAAWSTGLRLNDYVLTGKDDPRKIMREEFQGEYASWNNAEYLALIEWMRTYNVQHPQDPVQFLGDDFGYAGPELYDHVAAYVTKHHPTLLTRVNELYKGLRPTTSAGAYMKHYMELPLADRLEMAARTSSALKLLESLDAGDSKKGEQEYEWAVQHATAIDQTARGYAFDYKDPRQTAEGMRYRDSIMADNVHWWHERTEDKILVSAHDAHVAYESDNPRDYPRTQGAYLRDQFREDYLSVGVSFDHGSFHATDTAGQDKVFTVPAAPEGSNEHLLDRISHRDYVLDMRTVKDAARTWLSTPRPTRRIGTAYPEPVYDVALARSHDLLIHLHEVRASELLPTS